LTFGEKCGILLGRIGQRDNGNRRDKMARFSCTFYDAYGRPTKRQIEVETQALLADYVAVATIVVAALQDVTDLGLARIDLIIEDITAGFSTTPGSNIDVGATFSGILYDKGGAKASLKVPGIKASLVSIDGTVNIEQINVAAYLSLYEQDIGVLLLSDGEQIDTWLSGVLDR